MKFLVTGAAGFIGFHVANRLCQQGFDVVGLDNLNQYYDVNLKHARLKQLEPHVNFRFVKLDLCDAQGLERLFADQQFNRVIHLGAQAGIRYSIQNPTVYAQSNLIGFLTILECCRHHHIEHLIFASSSSVYGLNNKVPFSTNDNVDHPASFYAATKKSNELMAHSYAHDYGLATTGLRLFTVYGPWGRPDMALFKFTAAMLNQQTIDVYNHGDMVRDFSYIDDIVDGIVAIQDIIPQPDTQWSAQTGMVASSSAPYRIYNLGNGHPESLLSLIENLETALGVSAKKAFKPMQVGDVYQTFANIDDLQQLCGYRPKVAVKQGVENFVRWYIQFYTKTIQ